MVIQTMEVLLGFKLSGSPKQAFVSEGGGGGFRRGAN